LSALAPRDWQFSLGFWLGSVDYSAMSFDARPNAGGKIGADWFTARHFAIIVGLLIVAAYPDVVFGRATFYFRDYGFFSYPLAYYFRESFWRGEIPLWNPLNNCGTPFLAQWNTLVCYPPSLLYLVLPLTWALGAFTLLHWFLGAIGMYRLAYDWTGSGLAAALAGLCFAFNGMTLNCLMWPHITAALGWLPWVVLLTTKAWREGGRRLLASGAVGAMQMLTGSPEIILLTWVLLAALYAAECRRLAAPFPRSAGRFVFVVLLIAGLAAVQLLPFLQLLGHSNRGADAVATESSLPLYGWANFLVPLFRCAKSPAGISYQPDQFWTTSYYINLGALALALLSPLAKQGRRLRALGLLAAVCLLMSFGDRIFFYRWLGKVFPPVHLINFPVKYLLLVPFLISLMAASTLANYLRPGRASSSVQLRHLLIAGGVFAILIVGILIWARLAPKPYQSWTALVSNGLVRLLLLVLALGAVHLCRTRGPQRESLRTAAGLGLLATLWVDVSAHLPRQNPTVPYAAFEPGLQRLSSNLDAAHPGAGRILQSREARRQSERVTLSDPLKNYFAHRLSQSMNCNLLDGHAKVDGFYPLYIKEHLEVVHLLYALTNAWSSPLADFLSIAYLSSPTNLLEFVARESFLPLATAGQEPLFGEEMSTLGALASPTFHPTKTVYLPLESKALVQATHSTEATVLNRTTAHRIDIEANASEPTILVVAQSYYPPWRALVNGRPVRILRANHAFQAIELPAGRSQVSLQYVDGALLFGLTVSALTLLGSGTAWVWLGGRGRGAPSAGQPETPKATKS